MTVEEFSNGFDTLVNSFSRTMDFGDSNSDISFDEYEKSFYLTQAQKEIVVQLYTGRNSIRAGFEETEELRRYLAPLVVADNSLEPIETKGGILGMGTHSRFYSLPPETWYITYESVDVSDARCPAYKTLDVVPVTQDEYQKVRRNPFRGPNDFRALRLDLSEGQIEIICKYNITTYHLIYLKKPEPIVLTLLPEENKIDDVTTPQTCKLHEALHSLILKTAVTEGLQHKIQVQEAKKK